jgi:hypothetical protein
MTTYTVFAFCNECSKPHSTGIIIQRKEPLSPNQNFADVYDGRELPADMVNLTNNAFNCPVTKKMYTQADNNQVFLVRTDGGILPPWLRG